MEGGAVIGLCVGHSREGDRGAMSVCGMSEKTYWDDVAWRVHRALNGRGLTSRVWDSYEGRSYAGAMAWLGRQLRNARADMAVEFHFNAASDPRAGGHEFLHWHASAAGRMIAGELDRAMAAAYPETPRRGAKARARTDRGALFLSATHCPAVIAEPFFGTSALDWERVAGPADKLARTLAAGIEAAFWKLTGSSA
jgi:N-acetylmuramoyl-L-alanine amidase